MTKKLLLSALVLTLLLSTASQITLAQATDVVIKNDGNVILVLSSDTSVLGVTTEKPKQVPKGQPSPPSKVVSLIPAHTESTVHINAPVNNDKKIQVTIISPIVPAITTPPTKSKGLSFSNPANSPISKAPSPVLSPSSLGGPANPTPSPVATQSTWTKSIDQVIAQGVNGQPVITIRSDKASQLTIQQGSTQVTTLLPLQVDTVTHSLSVTNATTDAPKVSVLPTEAIKGILDKGLLDDKGSKKATINLTNDSSGVNYNVTGQRTGRLFGIFAVQTSITVQLSARTGKVVNTSQSPLFSFLGRFIN